MSIKSVSTLSEVSGLNSVVQHLQDLALHFTKEDFHIKQTDALSISLVVEAIQELAQECYRLHEKLETETIRASILRHKLKFFPEDIRQEIQRAVNAARDANLSELNRLQNLSTDIDSEIIFLEKKLNDLNEDNKRQTPEHERVRVLYEETIARLNEQLSEKARKQIHLNETKDRIQETNEKISDLEDGILQLRDDLIQERAEARNEKKYLQKETSRVLHLLKHQEDINSIKKLETDKLFDEMSEMKSKIDILKESTLEAEMSRDALETREVSLIKNLEKLGQVNNDLRKTNEQMSEQLADNRTAFGRRLTELRNRINELDEITTSENRKTDELKDETETLEIVLKEKIKIMEEDNLRVKERNAVLQGEKRVLSSKSEETARMLQEIAGMDRGMIDLGHTHRALMDTLLTQVKDCRNHMAKERQERMVFDDELQRLEKEMDDFQRQSTLTLKQNQRVIVEGKKEHDRMMQENARLQTLLKEGKAKVMTLEQELVLATDDLAEVAQTRSGQVSDIRDEIKELEKMTRGVVEKIEEEMPQYVQLEREFLSRREAFEQTKKDLVASKNKVKKLEESIRMTRMETHETTRPQEELRKELDNAHQRSFEFLKDNMQQLQDLEQRIYVVNSQLTKLKLENSRFSEGNTQLEKDMGDIEGQMLCNEELIEKMNRELEHLRAQLVTVWTREREILEEVSKRDSATVEEFGLLLDNTEKRQDVVSEVAIKLKTELSLLAEFMGQVSRRRPKSAATKEKEERTRDQQKNSTPA